MCTSIHTVLVILTSSPDIVKCLVSPRVLSMCSVLMPCIHHTTCRQPADATTHPLIYCCWACGCQQLISLHALVSVPRLACWLAGLLAVRPLWAPSPSSSPCSPCLSLGHHSATQPRVARGNPAQAQTSSAQQVTHVDTKHNHTNCKASSPKQGCYAGDQAALAQAALTIP